MRLFLFSYTVCNFLFPSELLLEQSEILKQFIIAILTACSIGGVLFKPSEPGGVMVCAQCFT